MIMPSFLTMIPFLLIGAAALGLLAMQKFYVSVSPDEYVVHYRNGKVKHIGRGISFFCFPYDTYLKVPGTLRDINFVADQITKEKQGVRVQGFLAYKICDFEKAYQNLDLRSNVIRTLPKVEDNVRQKEYDNKNRERVIHLDPSDPLAKTDEILRRLAESVVRHEVSNKTLEEMITEREVVVQSMREQVMGTVTEWGISVDTIEFAEVWIRSKELFENLQAEYRNSARLDAQKSTSETDKEIAAKQMESEKSIALMTAEAEREKRVISSQENLTASEQELRNQQTIKESEVETNQKLELQRQQNEHSAELAAQALAHEREQNRARNELEKQERHHSIELDRRTKEEELKRREAETAALLAQMTEQAKIEQAEYERKREAVEQKALEEQKESEARQSAIALEAEVKRIKELAAAQLARAKEEAKATLETGQAEAESTRLKIEAQNAVNTNQLQEQLIARLPQIAESMKIDDVHWISTGGNGDSPLSIVPKNMVEMLSILKGFGIDVTRLAPNHESTAQSPEATLESPPAEDPTNPPRSRRSPKKTD